MIHSCTKRYAVALISPYAQYIIAYQTTTYPGNINYTTAYPTVLLHITTFRQDKTIKNEAMTTRCAIYFVTD